MWYLALLLAAQAAGQESKAIAYLAGEVRDWPRENRCFSCHNNGDAARALYIAQQLGKTVPADALPETAAWLRGPSEWDKADANPEFHDALLARIQFGAALVESRQHEPLIEAADSLIAHQQEDGTWRIDAGATPGSPATYGTALATLMAMRTLKAAGADRFAQPIRKALRWFEQARPASVPDCAATLLALSSNSGCLTLLSKAQNGNGGWGPWANAPSEPFDTALALLALPKSEREAIEKGRAFLLKTQEPSGGWPATTRPPGGQSYAQHISTSAWALIALLHTERN